MEEEEEKSLPRPKGHSTRQKQANEFKIKCHGEQKRPTQLLKERQKRAKKRGTLTFLVTTGRRQKKKKALKEIPRTKWTTSSGLRRNEKKNRNPKK